MFSNSKKIRWDITIQDLAEVAVETEERTNCRFQQAQQERDELHKQIQILTDRLIALEQELRQLRQEQK